MTHESRTKALKTGSLAIAGFGFVTFLSLFTPVSLLLEYFFQLAIWPPHVGGYATDASATRLLIAIAGGLTFGLGVMLYQIADKVHPSDPVLGGRLMLTGILSWFVVDSLGSIISTQGGWANVILNLAFLLVIALPVLWPETKSVRSPSTA